MERDLRSRRNPADVFFMILYGETNKISTVYEAFVGYTFMLLLEHLDFTLKKLEN